MWWASVKEKRDTGFGGGGNDETSDEGAERDPGPGQAENDLARVLKDG